MATLTPAQANGFSFWNSMTDRMSGEDRPAEFNPHKKRVRRKKATPGFELVSE